MLHKEIYQEQSHLKKDISKLYLEAFPENERPPLDIFFKSLKQKEITLLAFYDEEIFIGFTYLAIYKDICCLYFFAVDKKHRHQGYGGQIIEFLKKEYKDYVLMLCYEEVDPKYENYEDRVSRKAFYYHHGFKDNKIKTNEYGVIYETAYIGSHHVSFIDYFTIFRLVFGPGHETYVKDASNY